MRHLLLIPTAGHPELLTATVDHGAPPMARLVNGLWVLAQAYGERHGYRSALPLIWDGEPTGELGMARVASIMLAAGRGIDDYPRSEASWHTAEVFELAEEGQAQGLWTVEMVR